MLKKEQLNAQLNKMIKEVKNEPDAEPEAPKPEQPEPKKRLISRPLLTDMQILKKHHKFLREDDEDQLKSKTVTNHEYGQRMAKKYYAKLFKEYAIVDLSQYESGRIGCRWRTEGEVLSGKGQKTCGAKKCEKAGSETYEFNFGYEQQKQRKNALVKVKLCAECAIKLNYKKAHVKIEEQ